MSEQAQLPVKRPKPRACSVYTKDLANDIIADVANGTSARAACLSRGVAISTFLDWVQQDRDGLSERYAHARATQVDALAEEILDVARSATPENANAKKVELDALKWILSRRAPGKYGDRLSTEVSGPGGGPVQTSLEIKLVRGPE